MRQGDHINKSGMLAVLINRAKEDGKVGGLIPHLVDGGVSILQYADDIIIFMKHDIAKARNMKLVLCLFEQLFGPKINFNKSELFCFGRAKEEHDNYIGSCLDVSWDHYHFDTWESQYITENYVTKSGNVPRIDSKRN